MLTIETHYHVSPYWMEPVEVLLFHMERSQVDKAVLVQLRGEADNSYLLECARRFPGRFAVVAWVDVSKPDAPDTLSKWAALGVQGVRLWATERSPGSDPLAIWRRASDLRLVVSCAGRTQQFGSDDFSQLVEQLPDLPIIIEHLGIIEDLGPVEQKINPKPPYASYRRVLGLSHYPNVFMKVPALGEMMPRPMPLRHPAFDITQAPPFIDMALDAFGAHRLMIGGDPVSHIAEGYANAWRDLREYFSKRSTEEQEAVFGRTAASLFRFEDG